MDRRLLPILALLACQGPESGLDNSVIEGTLLIPPASVAEGETAIATNDDAASAFGVGPEGATSLTYRAVVLDGVTSTFTRSAPGDEFGDADWYSFRPIADGSFTVSFSLPGGLGGPDTDADTTTGTTDTDTTRDTGTTDTTTTGVDTDTGATDTDTGSTGTDTAGTDTGTTGTDTGSTGTDTGTTGTDTGTTGTDTGGTTFVDAIVYTIRVYDMALYDPADPSAGLVAEGSTDGAAGSWSATFDVAAGGEYAVVVGGVRNTTAQEEVPYELVFSGSAPGEGSVLVGAYAEGDPAVGSPPLGGAEAALWTYDAATLTWSGFYSIKYVRSVTSPPADTGDTGAPPEPVIDETIDTVYIMAGTLQSLNKTPSAGALYTSQSIEVAIPDERVILPDVLVLDAVFPKVIGRTITEELPDVTVAVVQSDYSVVAEDVVAQDVGMLSGLGYVDVVDGAVDMSGGASGWNGTNDSDAYAFTVPEEMYVSLVASWADAASDIDFGIWGNYDPYGVIDYFSSFSSTTTNYCLTGANPETCTLEVPLEPGVTYYLVALGFQGNDVEPYHIELEWIAP
jgi:hypothetical protein